MEKFIKDKKKAGEKDKKKKPKVKAAILKIVPEFFKKMILK